MPGVRKKFDERLDKWAKNAEFLVRQHLKTIGYEVIHLPHGKYGKDHICESDTEKFFVEVERRSSNAWKDGEFCFGSVHVPSRRSIDKSTLLFVVRCDLEKYLVVFPGDIEDSKVIEVPNRFVKKDEMFHDVPLIRCLPVECSDHSRQTIAERNRDRVIQICNQPGIDTHLSVLGASTPYGMTDSEWRERYVKVTESLGEALFGDKDIYDKPWEDPTWK